MAKIPTISETIRAILDQIATFKVRAGEIVPRLTVETKLQLNGFRSEDITHAYNEMRERGLAEFTNNGFIKLTEAGYAMM